MVKNKGFLKIFLSVLIFLLFLGTVMFFVSFYNSINRIDIGKKIVYHCKSDDDCVLVISLDSCCGCPHAADKTEVAFDPNQVVYEYGKDYSDLKKIDCSDLACSSCQFIDAEKVACVRGVCTIRS